MPGIALKRWHWLDNGLLPVAAAVMYAAWAYPLFAVHVRDPSTGVRHAGFTFWLCLGILLGGAAAGRIAGRLHRGAALVVGGGFAAILICLLLVAPSGLEGVGSWFAEDAFRPTAIAAKSRRQGSTSTMLSATVSSVSRRTWTTNSHRLSAAEPPPVSRDVQRKWCRIGPGYSSDGALLRGRC